MTNFEFLTKYEALQKGIMFDRAVDLGFGRAVFYKEDKDPFWNYILVNRLISCEELGKAEDWFSSVDRVPSFYFENRKALLPLAKILMGGGVQKD